jgi:hypothetical protein
VMADETVGLIDLNAADGVLVIFHRPGCALVPSRACLAHALAAYAAKVSWGRLHRSAASWWRPGRPSVCVGQVRGMHVMPVRAMAMAQRAGDLRIVTADVQGSLALWAGPPSPHLLAAWDMRPYGNAVRRISALSSARRQTGSLGTARRSKRAATPTSWPSCTCGPARSLSASMRPTRICYRYTGPTPPRPLPSTVCPGAPRGTGRPPPA